MSNVLKVSEQEAIKSLKERGWSQRRIAWELGLNRRTVARYGSKCTGQVTPGSGGPGKGSAAVGWASKCTREVTPGAARGRSACEVYREEIQEKVGQGLSAQRIYQDLVSERGFGASYQSVKRFVAGLRAKEPGRVWRLESPPGEEMLFRAEINARNRGKRFHNKLGSGETGHGNNGERPPSLPGDGVEGFEP